MAGDWTEELYKIIPESRLEATYELAKANHESEFPVNAFEFLKAYKIIQTEEVRRMRERHFAAQAEGAAAYNSPHFKPCETCFGCGFKTEVRRFEGIDVKGVTRCYGCDYWERYKQKHNL